MSVLVAWKFAICKIWFAKKVKKVIFDKGRVEN